MKTVNDYINERNYFGHLILVRNGEEIINTIESEGDFSPDGLFYEIVNTIYESKNLVILNVK